MHDSFGEEFLVLLIVGSYYLKETGHKSYLKATVDSYTYLVKLN